MYTCTECHYVLTKSLYLGILCILFCLAVYSFELIHIFHYLLSGMELFYYI